MSSFIWCRSRKMLTLQSDRRWDRWPHQAPNSQQPANTLNSFITWVDFLLIATPAWQYGLRRNIDFPGNTEFCKEAIGQTIKQEESDYFNKQQKNSTKLPIQNMTAT